MAKEKEKTVFEVLAPVVGLPPSGVEERFADFDASAIAAMQEAARKTDPVPVATLRALFNAAARDAAKRLAEKYKATGPEADDAVLAAGVPGRVIVSSPGDTLESANPTKE